MKKAFLLTVFLPVLLLCAACGSDYDYTRHISETRSDIFIASSEHFTVTLSCITREHPYASDGITCPLSELVEIVLKPEQPSATNFEVYVLGEEQWGGEMSFRNVEDDWFYSQSVKVFPESSVSLRVVWDSGEQEVLATSVKNDGTMSVTEALKSAISHEKTYVDMRMQNGAFTGEFRVRLLRRDVNYYYVAIVDADGHTLSLLLGAESGEVLARRESA